MPMENGMLCLRHLQLTELHADAQCCRPGSTGSHSGHGFARMLMQYAKPSTGQDKLNRHTQISPWAATICTCKCDHPCSRCNTLQSVNIPWWSCFLLVSLRLPPTLLRPLDLALWPCAFPLKTQSGMFCICIRSGISTDFGMTPHSTVSCFL